MLDPEGSFAKSAADNGYDDVDAYLQLNFGKGVTTEIYHDYLLTYYTAVNYYKNVLYGESANALTDAEVEAYYDENAQSYIDQGVTKVNNVSVRHILIQPEGKNDDGTYTDEAWAEAEKKANDLLTEWQNGEHTEDSFAFMAAENSQDPGSVENGGLYEDIYPGKMVDEFDAWCFDPARQPGDTGIVKTSYGYHIMYFSSTGEHAYWYVRAEEDYLNELSVSVLQEVAAKFEATESEQNAAIVDIMQQN